jgi:hypothetical protein
MDAALEFIETVRQMREIQLRFAGKRDAHIMLKVAQMEKQIDRLLEQFPRPPAGATIRDINETTPAGQVGAGVDRSGAYRHEFSGR